LKPKIAPTQHEVRLQDSDLIVSKTDLTGRITYVNRTFMRISNYSESEVLGKQHNVVRHPDMPRGVYRLMWETLKDEREFFGVVKNMTADGDFYWVLANVTLDRLPDGEVVGYYSVRRSVSAEAIRIASELYAQMMRIERDAGAASAPEASLAWLRRTLAEKTTDYDQFVLANCLG
jgi:aerotaxis receptor